jgi:8-amino-7-oxononanoate synthase
VFARVHTFGKALGVHGAAVVGSAVLRSYLVNYARSLIYTTSLPPHALVAIRTAYTTMAAHPEVCDARPPTRTGRCTHTQGGAGRSCGCGYRP